MAWDSSRPVPFRRLFREWLIVAPILGIVFWLIQRDSTGYSATVFGLVISLPLYIGFGFALAKLGYHRKSLADLRTPRAGTTASEPATPAPRPRPAPTRRTGGGGGSNRKRR